MPPAARLGDLTAHGGTIVVGEPTVLINGMPAARQGDMHVCPMVTGVVPHVGGPIAMGSTTVMINKMPAARVGDMCTCSGPPDTIAMGEPTVQINDGGNPVMIGGKGPVMIGGSGPVIIGGGTASGGGGGGGGGGGQGAVAGAAAAEGQTPEETELEEHWLNFAFEDAAGNRASGMPYELEDPDGNAYDDWIRGNGAVRKSRLSEGNGTATLRQVSGAEWSTTEATVGEEVTVTAQAKGVEGGTPATVQIKEVPAEGGGSAAIVAEIEAEVSGEEVEATWAYTHEEAGGTGQGGAGEAAAQQLPAYVAEVRVEGYPLPVLTGLLTYSDRLELTFTDEEGNPHKRERYQLHLPNGSVRSGTLDGNGTLKEEGLPSGECEVAFPDKAAL